MLFPGSQNSPRHRSNDKNFIFSLKPSAGSKWQKRELKKNAKNPDFYERTKKGHSVKCLRKDLE
jgi:hypothetical protein